MANIRTVLTIQYADELPPEEPILPAEPVEEKKKKTGGILSKVAGFFTSLFGFVTGKKAKEEPPEEEPTEVEPEPPEVNRKARKEELIKTASAIVEQHKKNISRVHPPSSVPGEYPALRSGRLQRSVYFKPRTTDSLKDNGKIKIGYKHLGKPDPAFYSEILAGRKRLGLADTADGMPETNNFGKIEIRYPGKRS